MWLASQWTSVSPKMKQGILLIFFLIGHKSNIYTFLIVFQSQEKVKYFQVITCSTVCYKLEKLREFEVTSIFHCHV